MNGMIEMKSYLKRRSSKLNGLLLHFFRIKNKSILFMFKLKEQKNENWKDKSC